MSTDLNLFRDDRGRRIQDDPFESELQAVIAATENSHQRNDILSTYDDAIKTYELVSIYGVLKRASSFDTPW